MFRASLALTLMASLIFAGCLEGGGSGLETTTVPEESSSSEGESPASSDSPSDPAPSSSSGPAPAGDDNIAPEADLIVKDAEGPIVEDNGVVAIEAEGPLTFDASGSSDADDDELSFMWTVDGEVDESLDEDKATLTLAPGTHVVAVTVSDGSLSDMEDVTVHVGPIELPSSGGDASGGGALNYSFEGDVGPDAMAPDAVAPSHAFTVPAGAQRVMVYMEWADYVSVPDVGEGCLVCYQMQDNLDLAITDAAAEEVDTSEQAIQYEYIELDAEDIADAAAGTWSANVVPTLVTLPARYSIDIVVFLGAPSVAVFNGTVQATQMITNEAGEDLPVDGAAIAHTLVVPAGTKGITARLEWAVDVPDEAPAGPPAPYVPIDFDFSAHMGEEQLLSSGNAFSYEFDSLVSAEGLPAGEWVFEIEPFLVGPPSEYVLVIEFA